MENGSPPANDSCGSPFVIASTPFTQTISTVGATDPGEPDSSCAPVGASVWYQLTNTGAHARIIFVSTFGSDFDTVLDVFTGACGDLTEIACDDDTGGGLQSSLTFRAEPGQSYLIRASGFAGETGSLTINLSAIGGLCASTDITGALGTGSPDHPGTSGAQTARLNRNGVASSCRFPKSCDIFTTGAFNFDAYTVPNDSGATQCVAVMLQVLDQSGCNLQLNAYRNSFDPSNICTNYLADAGLSSGVPPNPTAYTFEVPADDDLVLVVHGVNPGELGCNYTVTLAGNVCERHLEVPTLDWYGLVALLVLLAARARVGLRRLG